MQEPTLIRIGIVGCGKQGGVMAEAVQKTPSLVVVACADPDLNAAAQVMEKAPDATFYSSVEEMLAHSALDAVIIATPHHRLYETALAAIRAGKHVLVEKPIGMDEKEAAQLEEEAGLAGICFMSGYSFRYIPAWQQAHALIQAGAIGKVEAIVGSIGVPPMTSGWKATPETGGGPLLFVGSHLIDQVLWYVNDTPIEVFANVRYRTGSRAEGNRAEESRAEEIVTFQMRFAQGATAQCLVSQQGKSFFNYVDIYGCEGHISLRTFGSFGYVLEMESKVENKAPVDEAAASAVQPKSNDMRMVKHGTQLEEFVQAIQERRQPAVTVSDGRRVLKVMDAIIRSSRTGGAIYIG